MVATSREGSWRSIEALLDGGADINQQSGDGSTALLVAIQNGDAAVGQAADRAWRRRQHRQRQGLDAAVPGRQDTAPARRGTVPSPVIDPAAMMDVIKLLVEKGADVNARLKANTETLRRHHLAARSWRHGVAARRVLRRPGGDEVLLAHGADPQITTNDGTDALMALAGVGYGDGFTSDFGTPGAVGRGA